MENSTDPDKLASKLVHDLNCFPKRMYHHQFKLYVLLFSTLHLIETHFNAFANKADPDRAALVRAA